MQNLIFSVPETLKILYNALLRVNSKLLFHFYLNVEILVNTVVSALLLFVVDALLQIDPKRVPFLSKVH